MTWVTGVTACLWDERLWHEAKSITKWASNLWLGLWRHFRHFKIPKAMSFHRAISLKFSWHRSLCHERSSCRGTVTLEMYLHSNGAYPVICLHHFVAYKSTIHYISDALDLLEHLSLSFSLSIYYIMPFMEYYVTGDMNLSSNLGGEEFNQKWHTVFIAVTNLVLLGCLC